MKTFPILKAGDSVEIIAPAGRCSDAQLASVKALLESWQLHCIVDERLFGNDILCANTDAMRLELLKQALYRPDTKALICARGGYGSMRLLPTLSTWSPPPSVKTIVGMSDITALGLFVMQHWQWPMVHGAAVPVQYSAQSLASLKAILFAEQSDITFSEVIPLNNAAKTMTMVEGEVTGGNLCLIQTSLGTPWQLDSRQKIVLLEEIGERGYRVDRMLEQLHQSRLLEKAAAIVFGDFLKCEEPNGLTLIPTILQRFAEQYTIPVVQIKAIGHSLADLPQPAGMPIPLGKRARLVLGEGSCLSVILDK